MFYYARYVRKTAAIPISCTYGVSRDGNRRRRRHRRRRRRRRYFSALPNTTARARRQTPGRSGDAVRGSFHGGTSIPPYIFEPSKFGAERYAAAVRFLGESLAGVAVHDIGRFVTAQQGDEPMRKPPRSTAGARPASASVVLHPEARGGRRQPPWARHQRLVMAVDAPARRRGRRSDVAVKTQSRSTARLGGRENTYRPPPGNDGSAATIRPSAVVMEMTNSSYFGMVMVTKSPGGARSSSPDVTGSRVRRQWPRPKKTFL